MQMMICWVQQLPLLVAMRRLKVPLICNNSLSNDTLNVHGPAGSNCSALVFGWLIGRSDAVVTAIMHMPLML
jgi:hypothetical protein